MKLQFELLIVGSQNSSVSTTENNKNDKNYTFLSSIFKMTFWNEEFRSLGVVFYTVVFVLEFHCF